MYGRLSDISDSASGDSTNVNLCTCLKRLYLLILLYPDSSYFFVKVVYSQQ